MVKREVVLGQFGYPSALVDGLAFGVFESTGDSGDLSRF